MSSELYLSFMQGFTVNEHLVGLGWSGYPNKGPNVIACRWVKTLPPPFQKHPPPPNFG